MKKCRCKTSHHPHGIDGCNSKATENDDMCKACHDRAANEWASTLNINVFDIAKVVDVVVTNVNEIREFYQKNYLLLFAILLISLVGSYVTSFIITTGLYSFLISLGVDVVTFVVGFFAIVKIKEITKK